MNLRVNKIALLAFVLSVGFMPNSTAFAQDIETAKSKCDVEVLIGWAWGNTD